MMRLCELYILSSSCPNRKDNGAAVFSQFYLNGIHKPAFCNFQKNIHHRDGTIFYGKVFPSRNCHKCQGQKNVPRRPPRLGGLQKGGLIGTSVFLEESRDWKPRSKPKFWSKPLDFSSFNSKWLLLKFMEWFFWCFPLPKNEEKNKTTSLTSPESPQVFTNDIQGLVHRSGRLSQVLIATADGWRLHPKSRMFGALKLKIGI